MNATGASDPETGIKAGNAGYSFTVLGGFAAAIQTGSRVDVTFDGSCSGGGAESVSAIDNASVASARVRVHADARHGRSHGGALAINPYSSSTSVSIAQTDFSDPTSGIASNVLTRSNPQPATGSCPLGGYTGSTIVAGPPTPASATASATGTRSPAPTTSATRRRRARSSSSTRPARRAARSPTSTASRASAP